MSSYLKYRGKCKEMCDQLIAEDPSLQLVRGYYHEPYWNTKEQHWWCKDVDGNIIDPTKSQFPSGGIDDFYEEFSGMVECSECGCEKNEHKMKYASKYAFCSQSCEMRFVGL